MIRGLSASLEPKKDAVLSSKLSESGLQLTVSRLDDSVKDVVQVAMLPFWDGSSNSTAEVKLPDTDRDSTKVIIHKTDITSYGDAQLPMVIERDSRFLSRSRAFLLDVKPQTSEDDEISTDEYDRSRLEEGFPSLFSPESIRDEISQEEASEDESQTES